MEQRPGRMPAPGRAVLVRLHPREEGREAGPIELAGGIHTLGADPGCAVVLVDPRIAPVHAELEVSLSGAIVSDLGTPEGIRVNGEPVAERELADGDELALGAWRLRIELPPHPAPECRPETADPGRRAARSSEMVRIAAVPEPEHEITLILPLDPAGWAPDGPALLPSQTLSLDVLLEVGRQISTLQSLSGLLENLLDLAFKIIPADRGCIVLADEQTGQLAPAAWRDRTAAGGPVTLSRSIVRRVVRERLSIMTRDATADLRFGAGDSAILHSIRSALWVPLASPSRVHGAIQLDHKFAAGVYDEQHLRLLAAIGAQAGVAIENAKLYEAQKATFASMVAALAASIDARDPMTAGHSDRVAGYAAGVARRLGMTEAEVEVVHLAALLHDYGKIGVPDAVLRKPGKLTEAEIEMVREHPAHTAAILSKIRFGPALARVPEIAAAHHEWIDGHGYPRRLRASQIPLEARIIAVADVFDALASPRHYKKAMAVEEAYDHLRRLAGSQLDPVIVAVFCSYHRELTGESTIIAAARDAEPNEEWS